MNRSHGRELESTQATTRDAGETKPGIRPFDVLTSWHQRVIEDDRNAGILTIDLRNFKATSDYAHIRTYKLHQITLSGGHGHGIYRERVVLLKEFPGLLTALRATVLMALERYHEGVPDSRVPRIVNSCLRIFAWMLSNAFYRLQDVSQDAIHTLVDKLHVATWSAELNYRRSLARLYLLAKNDPPTAKRLRGRGKSPVGLNIESVRNLTGLPIDASEVPISFRRKVHILLGLTNIAPFLPMKPKAVGNDLSLVTETFNFLASTECGEDHLLHHPFPVRLYSKTKKKTQTRNITLSDAVKIASHSLEWIYDRAPHVLDLLEFHRQKVLEFGKLGLCKASVATRVMNALEDYCDKRAAALPWLAEHGRRSTNSQGEDGSIPKLIKHVLTAGACLIAMNHGRRVNEVIGQDLPYGVHYGCVRPIKNLLHDYRVELYVEKSLKDFAFFPANILIHDVVAVLEKVFDATQPKGLREKSSISNSRVKLFVVRTLRNDLQIRGADFDIRDLLGKFLTECGVEETLFDNTQWPFRRMFVDLYLHRYDSPEVLALSSHLGHMTLASTLPYGRDEVERPSGESLNEIRATERADFSDFTAELNAGRFRYLAQKIVDMLNLAPIGGIFPRLVLRLAKTLSKNVEFERASVERKASSIAQMLESHGYGVSPMIHISCMAGRAQGTRKLANCYRDGELRREEASNTKCSRCPHGLKTENHLNQLEAEISTIGNGLQMAQLPVAILHEMAIAETDLIRILASEKRIAAENIKLFDQLNSRWEREVAHHDK